MKLERGEIVLKMNRQVFEKDGVFLGTGTLKMKDGEDIRFDFGEIQGTIDQTDSRRICYDLFEPETAVFPEMEKLFETLGHVVAFPELAVETDETKETDSLKVKGVERLRFIYSGTGTCPAFIDTPYITYEVRPERNGNYDVICNGTHALLKTCTQFSAEA